MKVIESKSKVIGFLIGIIFLFFFKENQAVLYTLAALIMLSIGIPHGALDHLLFLKSGKRLQLPTFIACYVGIILAYLTIWYFAPIAALIIFLLISAYHFGQTHFVSEKEIRFKKLTYTSLGSFYLTVILMTDFETTAEILQSLVILDTFQNLWFLPIITFLILSASLILVQNSKDKVFIILEMLVLGTLLYALPLLIGFVLYFGFWHAWPSIKTEYSYINQNKENYGVYGFIKDLLPFTLLSLVGMAIIFILIGGRLTYDETVLLFFVLVSLISAPHIWVMDRFLSSTK